MMSPLDGQIDVKFVGLATDTTLPEFWHCDAIMGVNASFDVFIGHLSHICESIPFLMLFIIA